MAEHIWYTASGELLISPPTPSARTLSGGDAAPGRLGSFSPYLTTRHPNSDKLIEGFKWDERTWYEESLENIANTVPVNWDPSADGITKTYFQSGIGDGQDIQFHHTEAIFSSGLFSGGVYRPWVPVVHHGYFYDYDEEAYMYSDDSEVVYVTPSGLVPGIASEHNQVQLTSVPKIGVPVRADRYRWDNLDGKHYIDMSVRKVAEFTGARDEDDVRQATWNEAKNEILWELIDDSDPEFMVIDSGITQALPYAVFNQQFADRYPSSSEFEIVGTVTGASPLQQFHTTYAPIAQGGSTIPIEVYSYLSTEGVYQQWDPIPSSGELTVGSGAHQVRVDYDLGVLEFGHLTTEGINIPARGTTIIAQYNRSLRIEHEPAWSSDLATGMDVNINPIYRTNGQGFAYLSTKIHDATQVRLTADVPSIGANLFGPIYIGNTYVPVIATVTDDLGIPVEGAGVEIEITSDPPPGRFGSFGSSAFSISNNLGQAKAFYNPPTGIKDIGETILFENYTRDEINETVTLEVSNLLLEGNLNDIYLYQVWTNDALQGWFSPGTSENTTEQQKAYHREFFTDEDIWGPTGLSAPGTLSDLGGLRTSKDWEILHRRAWNLLQAEIFDSTVNTGKKVLCATYDQGTYDPHQFTWGAVAPFQPTTANSIAGGGYDVVFDTSQYDLPVPSGSHTVTPSGNLHGYFMVAPTTVSIRASTYNSRLNQTIYSNSIRVKLQVPSYLSGMWYIDAINENHLEEISPLLATATVGSGVPLGFRLKSSNITLAAALDGVTFLDVNPEYNAPIWDTKQPEIIGSGVSGLSNPYVQHRFTVT